ncbi:ATP-binding protein [Bradyrhizobium sp. Arg237L]|uniref:sensor histidine kinase n=1 Tax=Bradyrhizobium sp. Arg237L TaxID=3003352 RepID=UPI00249E01EE|nr:ATP-binding protein [Bradyrhizobium sp. Arg237L]MDI4233786.1 ATP-binding protein [Bradyrhizobium sp. Arg237L]
MLLADTLRSTTFKLALAAIVTFGVIASAIFIYVYLSTASFVRSRSDQAIMAEYSSLLGAYERSGRRELIELIQNRIAGSSPAEHVYLLVDHASAVLAGNLDKWPSAATAAQGWTEFHAPRASDAASQSRFRAMSATLPGGDRLLVGTDISDLDGFAAKIWAAVIAIIFLMFVIAVVASILVTQRTVGRIEEINATSRAIMQSGLDKRIPLRGSHDEWDRVAENLNLMLDRIEALMGDVKQVSDNVAHDLRTPLTRMRGRLEKAFHGGRIGENDQALIGDTIADLDAVLGMFSSITRIAHIETQVRKGAFRNVNLVEIASEVVELYDAAAERDGTDLSITGDREVRVTGDRDLLFDAIANLVDNAIKHGRAGGKIVVACENVDDGAVIAITDDGPGIPQCERDHVFKRFYRLEQSRYTPGNGLGLSLVAAVANLHGARIEMLDHSPGLQFKLWFSAPAS